MTNGGRQALSVGHVEEAEAGDGAGFEETFLQELLLDLADLDRLHLRAVGGQLAVSLFAERDELRLGGGGEDGGGRGCGLWYRIGQGGLRKIKGSVFSRAVLDVTAKGRSVEG